MFEAWCEHGILPSVIYNLPKGEIELLKAFYLLKYEKKGSE
jgi:hypothetical protein